MSTGRSFIDKEVYQLVSDELFAAAGIPPTPLLEVSLSHKVTEGEFTVNVARYAASLKTKGDAISPDLAAKINAAPKLCLIRSAKAAGPFLNLKVDRPQIFSLVVNRVLQLGASFGRSELLEPKRVIIEHTSANPNAPLHIGNLRNVMIGAHLSRLMTFTGYQVRELFFVNDLGGQIGLTVLGYNRLAALPDGVKLDQAIGSVYAIMNTFHDAQEAKLKLSELHAAARTADPDDVPLEPSENEIDEDCTAKTGKKEPGAAGEKKPSKRATKKMAKDSEVETDEEKARRRRNEIIAIAASLLSRFPNLYQQLADAFTDDESIHEEAAALNKAYEDRDPRTVCLFRKMVCDCLTGHQQTLDTYGVKHDRFDFESELSWDGTSGALLDLLRQSKYFHPETPTSADGRSQGAWIDLDTYLTDIRAARGAGGFMSLYPKFYVLRPNGTTLYTLRDVAYSMKKAAEADMVLNVICTEQNLPQQKVMLSLKALGVPKRAQFHLAYDLVKLLKGGDVMRMSGRRGIYVLADDLYKMTKDAAAAVVAASPTKHIAAGDSESIEKVTHVVAAGAMKYALLSVSTRQEIAFDVAKAVDPKGQSGSFVLYSGARIASILRKYEGGIASGKFAPEPAEVDWKLLNDDQEWELLTKYVMPFATLCAQAASPKIPDEPKLPEFGVHVVPQFAFQIAHVFSSYYGRVRVNSGEPVMYPRVKFCRAVHQVIQNALRLCLIEPLEAM